LNDYYSIPLFFQDIALLSIANILHRSGYINDAIVATSYTMDQSPSLVVAHFNMANLFAVKVCTGSYIINKL